MKTRKTIFFLLWS